MMDAAQMGIMDAFVRACDKEGACAFFDMGYFLLTGKTPEGTIVAHNTYKENNLQ